MFVKHMLFFCFDPSEVDWVNVEHILVKSRSSENLEMKAFEKFENAVFSRYSKFLLIGN